MPPKTKKIIASVVVTAGLIVGGLQITVLNVHSHPQSGDLWVVSFETTGLATLKIIPNDQNTIDDLDFVSLKCNGKTRTPKILKNDVIAYYKWFCNGTGEITHLVNVARPHILKFTFGNKTDYAYNSPPVYLVIDPTNSAKLVLASPDPRTTEPGLVGYWTFNGQNIILNATATDISGYGNNGTLGSTIAADAADPTPKAGIVGQALSFDGVNDYVDCGSGASLAVTTNFTIKMWVKMGTQTQDYARALEKGRWTADFSRYGYRFYTGQPAASSIRLFFELMGGGNTDAISFSNTSMLGTWYHLVATYQSGVTNGMKVYTNGVLFGQKTPTVVMSTDIDPLVIGAYSGGTAANFNGLIDEVRIYNRALSAEEVLEHYNLSRRNFVY